MAKYTDARYPEKINDLVDNNGNVNIPVGSNGVPIKINFADLLDENSEARNILADYLEEFSAGEGNTFIKLVTQDKATLEGYYSIQNEETNFKLFASYNNKYYFVIFTTEYDIDSEIPEVIVTIDDVWEIEL